MAPPSRRTFHGNPREEAQRDAAGIKLLQKMPQPSPQRPSEGDRVLLRTKPREKLDEALALKARLTMHKWKKDGSTYFPLTNGNKEELQVGKQKEDKNSERNKSGRGQRGGLPDKSDNLKSILDNYPGNDEAFAPPPRIADKNEEGKVLDKADLVDAVSNILMQMPPENILESSSAISMLARKLVDGNDSAIDSSFSQKFLIMSQIQVEVQRRLKEAKGYIEEIENMDKVQNPKVLRRRQSSIANMIRLLHGGAPSAPPPSKSEQVANQMRTIRRLLQSLHWPNLHHEFLKWVRNSAGYEVGVRDFLRGMEEDFDRFDEIDLSRDDVCVSMTKHELRLTKNLRRYQLQMRNAGQDLAKGETKLDKDQRKLDQALERKANDKKAEIRRISLRRHFTASIGLGARSPRGSPSPRSSRRSSVQRGGSSAATPSAISTESDEARESQADETPSHQSDGQGEFDINKFDDARFGHLKRIYKNHELKIEALNDTLARDNLRLNKVIEELKDQVRRLLELQALYESKTKNTLRRGSLFIPRRRALMMNRNEADANNVNILAKRIAHLQGERADLMEKIKELGKSLLEQKEKPRRGAIVNQIWTIVQEDSPDTEELARLVSGELPHAKVKGSTDTKDVEEQMEAEASEEEDQEEPENDRGGQAMQHRIQKLNQELDDIKQQITALASEVNQKAVPMSLGKAVAFEMQPQMRLIIHYTPLRPEIDFLVKKSEKLLALPKMQTAQSKKTLNDTFELAKDTFDTEAAGRKKCLQDAKLAFDAPKWEQELEECMALLTEQLLSFLNELTQEPGASTTLQDFQGRRPSIAGMQSVEGGHARAEQVGATAEETGGSVQGQQPGVGAAFLKVDSADLEAKRAEEARLRAQAQEAEKILKVHSKIREADEEIKKLLEEISQARAQQEAVDVPVEAPTVTSTHAAESEPKRRRSSRVVDEDPDEKVLGLIKAEGRKKLRILQTRNVKYKLLKKLLEQAGIFDELRLQKSAAPETNEERAERLQKDMENAHDRNRRLSKQLEFWDNRIEQRKSKLDTEKSKLRKEFGRNWEQKLERALMEQDQPDAQDVESIQSLEPEEEMPAPDFDLYMMRQNEEMEDFINNRKGHVIAKKYSRQIRSTIFRRRAEAEQAEQTEALQDSPQRKPLAAFPEVEEERGSTSAGLLQLSLEGESLLAPQQHLIRAHSRTSLTSDSEDTSESESSFGEEDVDLGPFRQSHRKGILETGAEDYMMSQFGDQPGESFLEGINRLRPSARHYTRGTRREGPEKKKRSKRRVSIQSFVDQLSEDNTGPNSRRPSTAMEVGHARRLSVGGDAGLEIYNSRISRASIESRPFSEGDRGEIHDIVREAMEVERKEDIDVNEWLQKVLKQKRRRSEKNKAGKLKGNVIDGSDVHIETVRLLRRAAQMAKKTQVSPGDLSTANLLQAHHMDGLSISGPGNAQHVQFTSKAEALLRQLVGQDEETWEQTLAKRAATARARYAATKAQLLALDTMESPVRSASKKEALKRYRARTASPARSMSDLARSPSQSRSKIGRDLNGDAMNRAATEAAAGSRLDAHKEITRLEVMSLHHSAARRRMMQATLSSDEEDEAGGKSILELAEASRKMQDFRGPSERVISQVLSNVSNMMSGPTAFFEEEAQDEKVAEVAAKWLGERSDTQPSLMVDASEAQATAAPISHSAFRPFRSRSKAPRKIRPPRRTSSVAGNSTSSSSDSEGFRSSRSTSRREGSAHSQRGENDHFRNVSYFIDLMNENDHRKRSKKQSKRRRKARERQKKQATRADFRWNSHMWRLMELQLDNPRPIAHKVRAAHSIATHTGSDEDKASHSPRFLQARTPQRRRGRTPRKRIDEGRTDTQLRQVEHPGETHAMIGKEKQADSDAALDLSPKSVQIKLEEGGWTRLPAISRRLSDARRASASSESTSLQSPWWGRNGQRPQRFGASRARVDVSTSEADRDRLRVQQWAEVGALAMGLPQKWSYQARA